MLGHTVMIRKHLVQLVLHSNYHDSFYHRPVLLVSLTVLLKKFTPQPDLTPIIIALLSLSIIDLVLILSLLLTSFWHSVSYWLLTDFFAWRNKIHNAQNWQGRVHKTAGMIATTICQYVTNLLNTRILKKTGAFGLRTRLWTGKSQGSKSGKGECFLSSPEVPDCLWSPHSFVVSMYCSVSPWIKRPGRGPNNTRVWSAEVMMLSSKFPLVLRFQLTERQQLQIVRVSGTDSTVKCGLVAVHIGTALLVKVSVFRCLV